MTDAAALHRRLLTLDTHIDIPWPNGPDPFSETSRRVDFPKMLRGGVSGGCFVAYAPQTDRTAENEQAAYARVLGMLETIRGMGRTERGIEARVASAAAEIEAAWQDGVLALVPAVENGFCIGAELDRLGAFRALGARYMTLTHNGHNALADSAMPRKGEPADEHGGLSQLGRSAIAAMNRLGLVVDIAHASRATMLQAADCSRTPVVSTHSCVRALCDHPRNLDDEQLDALKDVGGVVQITAVSAFLKKDAKPGQVAPADFADHVDYVVRRIGIAHVGISSDFDGGGGFSGWMDASESVSITAELLGRGYGEAELALLWGGNFLRVLREAEAAAG
ncbi:MAG TPA: membrane dipeptidase [Acetobacteraceae bacterium]|nr:membrane dipeptidase [Acetobacteraceae bacterium]